MISEGKSEEEIKEELNKRRLRLTDDSNNIYVQHSK